MRLIEQWKRVFAQYYERSIKDIRTLLLFLFIAVRLIGDKQLPLDWFATFI